MLEPKPKGLRLSSLAMPHAKLKMSRFPLPKSPTGIDGLDEVTGGGLPKGRTTLVCGSAGCGKTLLAMEFLAHGALQYGEPGVCMEFEEATQKLTANVPVHPSEPRGRRDKSKARCTGQHRVAVCRIIRRSDTAS